MVWNQIMPSEMRSALLSPVLHHGAAVGMVLLEHMMPRAYGSVDRDCLREIGVGLSAYMADLASPNDVGQNTRNPSKIGFQQELAQIFGTSLLLDEIFPSFVTTLAKAVPIDLARISWLDPNGCDLLALWASPNEGSLDTESLPETRLKIETRLTFKERTIGVLTIYRGRGEEFSLQEQDILDQLGVRLSPVVQAGRLYMFAKRQAYQFEQLKRLGMPPVSAEGITSLAEALAGQTEDIGQAEWSAVFMRGYHSAGLPSTATAVADQEAFPQHLMEEVADLAVKCFDEGAPVRRSLPRRLDTAPPNRHPDQVITAESIKGESWNRLAMPLQNAIENTGVLVLGRDEGYPWTPEEVYLLEEFVGEAANEVELARRQDDSQRAKSGEPGAQSNSLQHELLADISDSLRSPIASIKGFGSTMLESDVGWTQEMHLEFLKIIDRESDRLDQVVSDLLSPEQGEFGVAALRRETCRIDALLQESIANYALDAGSGPAVFNCDPTLPQVLVDPSRMAQVITYLVSEADEACPGNHGVTVAASWRRGRPSVSIGFAKLDGYSANFAGNWQGNSLRLEICRSLLSAHGEQLEILTPRSGEDLFRFFLAPAPQ